MKTLHRLAIAVIFAAGWAGGPSLQAQAGTKATLTAATLEQKIEAQERRELDALKAGNAQDFAELIAEEAVFVDPRGTAGKAEVVQHVSDFKLLEYTMAEVKVVALGPKSGVIAYKLTQKGSAHGREFTATVYASAVWVERDGKWVCVFSQETPARS
jgi:uncharacterized protein (TIGR02246 family)